MYNFFSNARKKNLQKERKSKLFIKLVLIFLYVKLIKKKTVTGLSRNKYKNYSF